MDSFVQRYVDMTAVCAFEKLCWGGVYCGLGQMSRRLSGAQIGYSLLNVSVERHREFMVSLTNSGNFENGATPFFWGGGYTSIHISVSAPGMISVFAAFILPNEALYQVMELLEGPDLFDFLAARSNKLDELQVVGLVRTGFQLMGNSWCFFLSQKQQTIYNNIHII